MVKMTGENVEFHFRQADFCQKCVGGTLSMIYFLIKRLFYPNFVIFNACKRIFGGGYDARLSRHVSPEGGWDTGSGILNSIGPSSRILIENPLPAGKKLEKSDIGEFTSMEIFTQLLSIERIRQSPKFPKVGFYPS
jgi:hypothetical protein